MLFLLPKKIAKTFISFSVLFALQLFSVNVIADTVVWNFTAGTNIAASSSNVNVPASGCTAGIGNSLGTVTTPINTTSASSGYSGVSGTYNIGNATKLGSFSTLTSSYINFTLTPNTGYSVTITGITFGNRCTATGPAGYSICTDVDGFVAVDASGTFSTGSTWALLSPATFSVTGAANTPVQVRIFGYNGSGSPGSGTENWRMDDITITYTANPTSSCSGTPLSGTASPSVTNICGSGSSLLSLTGGTIASGITYQWSSSATNTAPGTNIIGAISSTYTAAGISATTYFWCTTTCTISASTNISSVGTVSVNPTPSVGVTPSSGSICSGSSSGVSILASGADTYTWSPTIGLSATTGASVIATPSSGEVYTVTGTDVVTGCQGTNTVVVNNYPTPGTLNISPTSITACAGTATNLLTATGGLLGPTTVSSGTINMTLSGVGLTTETPNITIAGIPVGATITGAYVTLNASFTSYMNAYIFNLKAPNGKIINLIKGDGGTGTGSYTNTIISSSGTSTVSTGTSPFSTTYSADANAAAIPSGTYMQNTTLYSDLWGTPNGTWTLAAYHNYSGTDSNGLLISWSITLTYSYQAPVTWATTTNLFTDMPGTVPYTGTATNTIYENPLTAGVMTYTATATNFGCTSTATVTATVTPIPTTISGITNVCSGLTTQLSDGVAGGVWSSGTSSVATIDPVSGLVSGVNAGTVVITYSNGCSPDMTTTVMVIAPPGYISGATSVCATSNITLSDGISGGVWSSNNTSVAIVSTAGVVTGGIGGFATIDYSTGCGTDATTTVTVIASPGPISGASSVCTSSNITLSDAITGGSWSSSNTLVAIVSGSGVVTGELAGIATITYSTGCGLDATTTITVIASPGSISGATNVCIASNIALSDAVAGGIWSSGNTSVATVSATGIVTGELAGIATISYSTGCGTAATTSVIVISPPGSISGSNTVCTTSNITLSNAVAGGAWSSSNTLVASVSTSGVVNGGIAGTTTITYSTGCGIAANTTVTVIATPGLISGASFVCSTSSITLSDAVTGGVWSSNNTSVASVSAGGVVTGGIAGNATISYFTGCGSAATTTVTVIAPPGLITGASSVCSTSNITLSDAVTGGIWSSSNTLVATVTTGGVVTGGMAGNATIIYSTGCGSAATALVTIIATPTAITGASSVCATSNITLSDAVTGGVWSSNNTSVASISTGGVVTGGIAGTATITYSTGCGFGATKLVTVVTVPAPITGVLSVCATSNITLSDAVTGGVWSSNNTSVASVSTGGVVTGGIAGNATITYSTGCGSAVTTTVSVIAAPGTITGTSSVCSISNITLSDAVTGGTWSSNNTSVASVTASGIVTGGLAGAATISYSTGCGTDATRTITVIAAPGAISGALSVCATSNTTLSDAVTGGTWSSSNSLVATVNASGVVTGGIAGTATITYSTGCGSAATTSVTVIALPIAITGASSVCSTSNVTLSDAVTGGTWSSNNTSVASVTALGIVTGGLAGAATISYSTGCGTDATRTITVIAAPGAISGALSVCATSNTTLSDAITGGTWSSSNSLVATVNASGVVTGGIAGMATITYSTGCGSAATASVIVIATPGAITGALSVCATSNITLSDAVTGGTWSSNNTSVASVSAGGVVTGGIAGTVTITYSTGCGVGTTKTLTVISAPGAITGASSVCSGLNITLSNGITGGTWSSSNTIVATVSPIGVVTGGIANTVTITYSTGCGSDDMITFTVNPLPVSPVAITGLVKVCNGNSIMLSDITAGGVWSSVATSVATIDASGNVTSVSAGTSIINYTMTNGCGSAAATVTVTVELPLAPPAIITGINTVCQGNTTFLSDITPGGVWSSSNTSVAIVTPSGIVTGAGGGLASISYAITNSCGNNFATSTVTVVPLPAPATITGYTTAFCQGTTIALSDATPGGVWSSDITGIATVSSIGVVTGVSGGSSTIFYTVTNGCGTTATTRIVSINPLAVIGQIAGVTNLCAGSIVGLSDSTAGGLWSSSATSIAVVSNTGVVTGIAPGIATISYSISNSCGIGASTAIVTVGTIPSPGIITGLDSICPGNNVALSDNVPGGVWSSDFLAIAMVTSAGVVHGIATGIDTIRYTVINSCGSATARMVIRVLSESSPACWPANVREAWSTLAGLKVFPNPNNGYFTINGSFGDHSANEEASIEIMNMLGQIIYTNKVIVKNGEINEKIQLNNPIANGMYILNLHGATENKVFHIVIQQ